MRVVCLFIFFNLLNQSIFGNDLYPNNKIINLKIHSGDYVIGEPFAEIKLEALQRGNIRDSSINGKREILIDNELKIVDFIDGIAFSTVEINQTKTYHLLLKDNGKGYDFTIRYLPPYLSILPPLIAVVLALVTKEVMVSLFISILLGVLTLKGFTFANLIPALLTVVDTYILDILKDTKHLSVILFSFLVGGMVAVISQNGGMKGIAYYFSKYAKSPRSAQFMTFGLSLGIFYDNYSNSLIVGNTMRPVTDKFKVSREKLAFIVHGTAASITAIAFISTWIGAELGYINDATLNLGVPDRTYILFLKSLQFAFYPILMLFFIFILILLKKDFGPMNLAEVEARNAGVINANRETEKKENEEIADDIKMLEPYKKGEYKWLNAFLPIASFVIVAFIGLLITGSKHVHETLLSKHINLPEYSFITTWRNIHLLSDEYRTSILYKIGMLISYSDFYILLLWSSFTGTTVAIVITVLKKGETLRTTMESLLDGFKMMLSAIIILIFAWALAEVIEDLHTTDYLASIISTKLTFPKILPGTVFILAGLFSFATGSVWGTMAILYPLILPISWRLSLHAGLSIEEAQTILYMTTASIITGAILGNHCSPISDTTTVSSISSNCDRVSHIKTQVPYALAVGGMSLFLLFFSLVGLHWSLNFLLGFFLLFMVVKYQGKTLE